jgi:hypothetical protein
MVKINDESDLLLLVRLLLWKRELSYLYLSRVSENPRPIENEIDYTNVFSNTFLGEKMLLEV